MFTDTSPQHSAADCTIDNNHNNNHFMDGGGESDANNCVNSDTNTLIDEEGNEMDQLPMMQQQQQQQQQYHQHQSQQLVKNQATSPNIPLTPTSDGGNNPLEDQHWSAAPVGRNDEVRGIGTLPYKQMK